ncbi:MAG TPA: hypothetical protein VLG36_04755 [Candidatus Chromulinivoraceae bacterium]|nr:hypothetical protein [Candidatus Chromulinivoraceae bacterium]
MIDQRTVYQECLDSGWDPADKNSFAEEVAHLHEEISEAFQAWRLYKDAEVRFSPEGKPLGVPAEFADVVIGLLYNAERMGFDLWEAVEQKLAYNRTRNYTTEGRQLHAKGE